MDMRTKLVFTFVAAALGSMLVLGVITYTNAQRLLKESTVEQLEGLADTKKERLEGLITDWEDRVRLAASSTALRSSLREHVRTGGTAPAARIQDMLGDALRAVATFESLAVYDVEGRLVASAARDVGAPLWPESPQAGQISTVDPVLIGAARSDGRPRVAFESRLDLEGESVGFLRLAMDSGELLRMTSNRGGLGETGETLVIGLSESGSALVLTPLRHRSPEDTDPVELDALAARALGGEEGEFTEGMFDYRGEAVWAAIRHLPEIGWGLVVKLDAAEEEAPITRFRQDLTEVGTMLAAFATLLGIVVGLRFAKPIQDLAGVTRRLGDGDLEARASVAREDEIGLLARTFNDMADELEQRMTLLREFKTLFDVSLDMLCIAGIDGYFRRVNPAFERTLGWTLEELVDKPFNEFIHPDDVEPTNREVEKLAQGIPTISFENRFRCADGTYKHLRWTSHPEPEIGLLYAAARVITDERS